MTTAPQTIKQHSVPQGESPRTLSDGAIVQHDRTDDFHAIILHQMGIDHERFTWGGTAGEITG